MASRVVLAAIAVALIVGAGLVLYLPASFLFQDSRLAFHFTGGSAVLDRSTGETNVTLTIVNTGTVLVRLGGEPGVAPPPQYSYVVGTFHAFFYDRNGSQIYGGSGNPPVTTGGGKIVTTYLMTGANPGDTFQISTTLTANGMSSTQSISLTVVDCQPGVGSCSVLTTTTTHSSNSSTTSTTSTTSSTVTTSNTTTTTSPSTSSTSTTTSSQSGNTSSTTTSSTSTTSATTTSTSASGGLSWRFVNATAVYNGSKTYIVVWIQNTGTVNFGPKSFNTIAPNGTSMVSGSFFLNAFSPDGRFLCKLPSTACGGPPPTANGGWLEVEFQVTRAQPGNHLVLAYTIVWLGSSYGPRSIEFVVGT